MAKRTDELLDDLRRERVPEAIRAPKDRERVIARMAAVMRRRRSFFLRALAVLVGSVLVVARLLAGCSTSPPIVDSGTTPQGDATIE